MTRTGNMSWNKKPNSSDASKSHRNSCTIRCLASQYAYAFFISSLLMLYLWGHPAAGLAPGVISTGGLVIDGVNGKIGWPITYTYTSGSIVLSSMYLFWPSSNGNLLNITLENAVVYNIIKTPPSQLMTPTGTTADKSIYYNQPKTLWFNFQNAVQFVGNSAVESYLDTNIAGKAEAFSYTAIASGTATTFNLYLDSTNNATNITVGVYAGSTHPTTLLASGWLANPTAGAWNKVPINSVSITSGTKYWLAVLNPYGGQGNIKFRDKSSGTSESHSVTNLTSLPNTWSTGATYATSMMSAYLTAPSSISTDPSAYKIRVKFTSGDYIGYPNLPTCSIVGPDTVCSALSYWHNASVTNEITPPFTYTYTWKVDSSSAGSGKNMQINWASYTEGSHTLYVTQTEKYGSTTTYTWGGSAPYISKNVFIVKKPTPTINIDS